MTRRCSHCSNNGHNSRTCPTRGGGTGSVGGVRLFGVRLNDGSFMKKSASMGNLSHYYNNSHASTSAATSPGLDPDGSPSSVDPVRDGYLSDDPTHHVSSSSNSNRRVERKKGTPWTEEEHRLFLLGLQKLGKGDWRGIARTYVATRTPTQVASHAQKYFIRLNNATRRKRRTSLFDMVPDMVTEESENGPEDQLLPPQPETRETDNTNTLPSLNLSLCTESEPMEATSTEEHRETIEENRQPSGNNLPPQIPAFYIPIPYTPIWQQTLIQPEENTRSEFLHHQVLKPTPVHLKEPVNVDHLMSMSQLNLSEAENGLHVQPQLSLNILGAPSRQSAFHASGPASSSSELKEGESSVVQAV